MDKQPQSRAPVIVAIVLLLLPVLYVGSYFALVMPKGVRIFGELPPIPLVEFGTWNAVQRPSYREHYRLGGKVSARIFWPLEQVDRKLRPEHWGD
jgi:hypothetical protein